MTEPSVDTRVPTLLEASILSAIGRGSAVHARPITDRVSEILGRGLQRQAVATTVKRMEEEALIGSELTKLEGRWVRVFNLKDPGVKALEAFTTAVQKITGLVDPALLPASAPGMPSAAPETPPPPAYTGPPRPFRIMINVPPSMHGEITYQVTESMATFREVKANYDQSTYNEIEQEIFGILELNRNLESYFIEHSIWSHPDYPRKGPTFMVLLGNEVYQKYQGEILFDEGWRKGFRE